MTVWMLWINSVLFGLIWLLITGNNILCLFDAYKRGGSTSLTLFLGGIFGIIAVLTCPIQGAWIWFWIPAVVDPGCLATIFYIFRNRGKK